MFYFVFWSAVLFFFSSQSTKRSSKESTERIAGYTDNAEQWIIALDDLFNPHTIAKQNVINVLGVRICFH